jgi:hypothetical protein
MKTNPSDSALSLARAIIRGTRAVILPILLAAGLMPSRAHAYGTPEISLDASALSAGALTSWANNGAQAGSFSNDGTTVSVGIVDGKNCVTFTGANWMKASFTAPATITGNHAYTVVAQLYNPAIAGEEAYLTWAQRGTSPRCAQFNFGNATDFGAVTHWGGPDMGFNSGVPSPNAWHIIAVSFDGATENVYVDGALNATEAKTLNLWSGQPVFLGTSYGNADGSGKGLAFTGSMASLQVYSEALTASDIKTLSGAVFITGQVTAQVVGGTPIAGATVYYKLSANASVSPLGSATTDASGNYAIAVPQNTGPYYIAAGKTGYVTSDDSPPTSVTTTDVTGIHFPLLQLPAITGNVADGTNVYNAAVTVNTSTDGGVTLVPTQTVYTNTSGNYTTYVAANTTYYLTVRKSAHADATSAAVAVTTSDVTQNITLTRNAIVKLVDLEAAGLTSGGTGSTWTNTGTLGGTFAANAAYTVGTTGGRLAVDFTGATNINFRSSWSTATVVWPSALAGGDVQYSTVAWVYAAGNTGSYLDFSADTGPARGAIAYNPSYMRYRYGTEPWGCCDHINSTWVGWTGTNTNTPPPAYGTWHMIVNTYNGLTERLYVDGVLASTTGAMAIQRTFHPLANNLVIGSTVGNGDWFKGAIHRIQVFDQELAQTDVTQLWTDGNASLVSVSGTVSGPSGAIADAIVRVKDGSGTVVTTATTDASGTYSATLGGNSDTPVTYSLVASNWGYLDSAPKAVPVGGSNVNGVNFTLSAAPAIWGLVSNADGPVNGATVTVAPNPADSEALISVTTNSSGSYTAYVQGNKTYSVSAAKARNSAPPAVDVPVATTDMIQDITLVKSPVVKLVDLDAGSLTPGAITSWTNTGTKGGTFGNASSTATVVNSAGRNVVAFAGNPTDILTSSFTMANEDGIVGPACQYTTATWLYATTVDETGRYLQWAHGPWDPASAMWFNYGTIPWGVTDHLNSTFLGWGGSGYPGTGTWHFVACTYDGVTEKAYLDGQLISSATRSFNPDPGATMEIGCASFKGYIGSLQIYDQALGAAEIAALNPAITASAGANGSISPSGVIPVLEGTDATFTFTPDPDYAVGVVTVDGIPQPGHPASYTFPNVTAAHTIAVTFTTGPTSPYDTWALGPFANAFTDTDPGHDPDGDGMTNQQEFAFGLDPTLGSSINPITVPLDKATGKFSYTRLAASGLTYHVFASSDLNSWTEEDPVNETVTGTVDGVETVEVTVATTPVGGKLFVRIAAQ